MADSAAHIAEQLVRRLTPVAVSHFSLRATPPRQRTFTHAHRQRLERAVDVYLRWCYRHATAARSSELAARLGVSPQYLSGIAPKILGKSLRVFLRERQLVEAERLLRHTPLPVDEVAVRAAFGTPATLYRWFIQKHGIAPAAFREVKK